MSNDNFKMDGKLSIPTKWIVSVIAALSTALGGSGAAMYKIGKLESQVNMLTQLCGKHLILESNREIAAQKLPLKPGQ